MTNEEIETAAARIYYQVAEEVGRGGSAAQISLMTEGMRDLVSRAYDKAIKAACHQCAEGAKTTPLWEYAHTHGTAGAAVNFCDAAGIHALKDSLVQEPVSST